MMHCEMFHVMGTKLWLGDVVVDPMDRLHL